MKKNNTYKITLLLFVLAIVTTTFSQTTEVVKDISTDSLSYISNLVTFKKHTYFTQTDDYTGSINTLWRTDGTEAGTHKFKNSLGDEMTGQIFLREIGDLVYFAYDDGINGKELWKSDGTEAGTKIVKDINPSGSSDCSVAVVELGGEFYFSANDGVNGEELWKSDGTASGTVMVKDINTSGNSGAYPVGVIGSNVIFIADNGTTGSELWKTDGTSSGTSLVKDINTTGNTGSNPQSFYKVGSQLLFTADNGTLGRELWRTDGTSSGTTLVKDINPGTTAWIAFPVVIGNQLFFRANNVLWKSDGTLAGTVKVKDISCSFMFNFNGVLVFQGDTANGLGTELWKSDGTEAGTVMIKDINTSAASSPQSFHIYNNELYFSANDGWSGLELWKSDGTENGTTIVDNINSNGNADVGTLVTLGNLLLFNATDGSGVELWKHSVCSTPATGYVNSEIDELFVSITMPSGKVITEEGVYEDTLRNSFGCDSVINTFTLTKVTTGINDLAFENLSIYPNPTNGIINLNVSEELASIRIMDLTGKTIKVFNADTQQLDISEFTTGIYFLEIANTERKSVVKIIKK